MNSTVLYDAVIVSAAVLYVIYSVKLLYCVLYCFVLVKLLNCSMLYVYTLYTNLQLSQGCMYMLQLY